MTQLDCKLCNYFKNCFKSYQILTRALYNKYSQSQEYFYGKLVDNFIQSKSNKSVIEFKDQIFYYDDEEYIKKVYQFPHLNKKIKDLIEYYKYHTEIPRVYMLPISLVCNYFHDKKRRINYYKTKLLLHQQNGNQEPLQKTESISSSSEISSTPSNSQFVVSQFLKPLLLKSFNFNKPIQIQKDTVQEINGILQNLSKLNLKDVEQYSYFLMDTQISDQSVTFKKGFQNKLQQIKNIFYKLQQKTEKKLKFKQKPVYSQKQDSLQQKVIENVQKQIIKQKSIQNLLNGVMQQQQIQNNIQNYFKNFQTTRNVQKNDNKIQKKKQNNFRTKSESYYKYIQVNVDNLFQHIQKKEKSQDKKPLIKKQIQIRPLSNDKQNIMTKHKKQSLDFQTAKQSDKKKIEIIKYQNFLSPKFTQIQNFNNLASPQLYIIPQKKNQEIKNSLNRNRLKNPQSLQITNDFLLKVNKQLEGDRLKAMIQIIKEQQKEKQQQQVKHA